MHSPQFAYKGRQYFENSKLLLISEGGFEISDLENLVFNSKSEITIPKSEIELLLADV
jgi:hypothetical protein